MHCGSDEREWLLCTDTHLRDSCARVACSFAWVVGAICYERAVVWATVRGGRTKDHVGVACGGEESDGREGENGHDGRHIAVENLLLCFVPDEE